MNFYKYFIKKVSVVLIGIILTLTFSYVILAAFVFPVENIIRSYGKFQVSIFSDFKVFSNDTFKGSFSSTFDLFSYYYRYSFIYVFLTFVLSLILGFILGIIMAYKANKLSDLIISLIVFALASIPTFIFAPLFILFNEVNDLPIAFIAPNSSLGLKFTILSMVMPILLLAIVPTSYFATLIKNKTLNILQQDYILSMKSLGLSNRKIFFKGVLKNLIGSILNHLTSILLITVSFSLIFETIFQIPGQSQLIINMFDSKELNVLAIIILFKSILFFIFSFICEVLADVINVQNANNFTFKISLRKIQGVKHE